MTPQERRAAFITAVIEHAGDLDGRQRDELAALLPVVDVLTEDENVLPQDIVSSEDTSAVPC